MADVLVLLLATGTAVVALIVKAYEIVQKKVVAPVEDPNEAATSETSAIQRYEPKLLLTKWGKYSLALIVATLVGGLIKATVVASSSAEAKQQLVIAEAKQAGREEELKGRHLHALMVAEKHHRTQLDALHARLDEAEAKLAENQRELVARTGRPHQEVIVTIETGSRSKARTIEPVRFRLIGSNGTTAWKNIRAHSKKFENGQTSDIPFIIEPPIGEIQKIEIQKRKHNTDGWVLAKIAVKDAKEGVDYDGDLGAGFAFVDKTDAVADGWLEKGPINLKRR